MKELIVLVGCPGSGKTTLVKQLLQEGDVYVSRDEVRFSLVQEDEEYFSRETEVYDTFVQKIQEGLDSGSKVYADATHLNTAARVKLLRRLSGLEDTYVTALVVRTSLETCLKRNSQREGRAVVPESAVRSMYRSFTIPSLEEGFDKVSVREV